MFGWGVKINNVTGAQLEAKLQAGTSKLIDVREPYEFAGGHVPGATNIPLGTLSSKLDKLDPTAETYVICQSGNRSRSAVKLLTKAGFEHVYNVVGGTSAWRGELKR